MHYSMEELLPVVAKLTERYTGNDSTSVTYETASQLMGAVIYCLKEGEESEKGATKTERTTAVSSPLAKETETDGELWSAYQRGYEKVVEKVGRARRLYHSILEEFESYGNICCEETIVKGMPEFFKHYDARFCPQNELLTLDYPVLCPLGRMKGVDRIYRYLSCIWLEQKFLRAFSKEYVERVLNAYSSDDGDAVYNLSSVIMRNTARHKMIGKTLSEYGSQIREREQKGRLVRGKSRQELVAAIGEILYRMTGADSAEGKRLYKYLLYDGENFAAEMENCAEHGCLERIFVL